MKNAIIFLGSIILLFSCRPNPKSKAVVVEVSTSKITVPEWAKNANLYEVNVRQYTEDGTFRAFQGHLPRLRDMGVKILWFMPIHPISEKKRKGSLGSYYAVSDFRAVNPHFGTMEDFVETVNLAHEMGMKVIIDWVPHHTGWDHVWITEHPEYFSKDEEGNIIDPINEETGEPWGWTDVAELRLDNPDMRRAIIDDMVYWMETANIDGFRVDHAHGVPDDYWDQVSATLSQLVKQPFMLAEGEEDWLRNDSNFVMTYAWEFHHAMNALADEEMTVDDLVEILEDDRKEYTYGYHTYFTSNHDENSWAGTVMERYGDGHLTFAVLAATVDGMPLIYSGQEEPITKRLEFFEKDQIDWGDFAYQDFYTTLLNLKYRNQALWNGDYGGYAERINEGPAVFAYKRIKNDDRFYAILNLTDESQTTSVSEDIEEVKEVFTNQNITLKAGEMIQLKPWEYIVLSSK